MQKYTKTNKNSSKPNHGNRSRFKALSGPADEIDALCRKKLPEGVIRSGNLVGREPEIRQDALIMALSGFLEGHPGYRSAKESGNQVRVCVVQRAADEAVKAKKLSPMNAWILNMVVPEGMNVAEILGKIPLPSHRLDMKSPEP